MRCRPLALGHIALEVYAYGDGLAVLHSLAAPDAVSVLFKIGDIGITARLYPRLCLTFSEAVGAGHRGIGIGRSIRRGDCRRVCPGRRLLLSDSGCRDDSGLTAKAKSGRMFIFLWLRYRWQTRQMLRSSRCLCFDLGASARHDDTRRKSKAVWLFSLPLTRRADSQQPICQSSGLQRSRRPR